ncbi:MAG: DUF374 domain-containing protein [Ignavibacteria bacterium]|nr:DUF374 domain-containing protein [Ignavibacteria bacterium]
MVRIPRVTSVALVSPSTDGAILADLLTDWGYTVVKGSSSRGGKEALQIMVEQAANSVVLITPDGPRGPAHVAKPVPLSLHIVPACLSSSCGCVQHEQRSLSDPGTDSNSSSLRTDHASCVGTDRSSVLPHT